MLIILSAMALLSLRPGGRGPYEELTREELGELARQAADWMSELEERQRPLSRALTETEKEALGGFFSAGLLERARLKEVGHLDNPEFYEEFFSRRGEPLPIDFRRASGLALLETILVVSHRVPPNSPRWLPLLFHELVHLAQVEALGRDEHVADYVRGWAANGFTYRDIPQEAQAFELTARYRAAPARPFSVAAEVAQRFGGPAGGEPAPRRER